jgi:hypothetical protein
MFLGGDRPRKAANFGIPKRGNFGIPKWDFFLRADAPDLCRRRSAGGIRRSPTRIGRFLFGSIAPLDALVNWKDVPSANGIPERRACSIAQTHGLRNARLPVPTPPQASHKNEIGYRVKDEHTAVPPVESPDGSEGGRET